MGHPIPQNRVTPMLGTSGAYTDFLNQITFSFEMSTYTFDSLIVVTLGDKDAG